MSAGSDRISATAPSARRPSGKAMRVAVMGWVRRWHLYSGVLFAPAILFFCVTGLIQVFNLHKAQPSSGYQPPPIVMRLAALHKDQTVSLPRKASDAAGRGKRDRDRGGDRPAAPGPVAATAKLLLKGFAAATAIGLFCTTLMGLYMAYALGRKPWLVAGLFIAGLALPAVLILAASVGG